MFQKQMVLEQSTGALRVLGKSLALSTFRRKRPRRLSNQMLSLIEGHLPATLARPTFYKLTSFDRRVLKDPLKMIATVARSTRPVGQD
jgi:hypothetical protein